MLPAGVSIVNTPGESGNLSQKCELQPPSKPPLHRSKQFDPKILKTLDVEQSMDTDIEFLLDKEVEGADIEMDKTVAALGRLSLSGGQKKLTQFFIKPSTFAKTMTKKHVLKDARVNKNQANQAALSNVSSDQLFSSLDRSDNKLKATKWQPWYLWCTDIFRLIVDSLRYARANCTSWSFDWVVQDQRCGRAWTCCWSRPKDSRAYLRWAQGNDKTEASTSRVFHHGHVGACVYMASTVGGSMCRINSFWTSHFQKGFGIELVVSLTS